MSTDQLSRYFYVFYGISEKEIEIFNLILGASLITSSAYLKKSTRIIKVSLNRNNHSRDHYPISYPFKV